MEKTTAERLRLELCEGSLPREACHPAAAPHLELRCYREAAGTRRVAIFHLIFIKVESGFSFRMFFCYSEREGERERERGALALSGAMLITAVASVITR